MKVILLEELKGKGGEGDVVDVAPGFANNYLLIRGMAVKATPGNLKQLEQRRKNIAKREEVRVANAQALKEKLEGLKVFVAAQVGEEGQLFGSVTAPMVAEALAKHEIEIDKRRVELTKPIKTAGEHVVAVSLYREIKANVTVLVGADEADFAEPVEEVAEEEQAVETEQVEEAEEAPAAEQAEEAVEAAEEAAE